MTKTNKKTNRQGKIYGNFYLTSCQNANRIGQAQLRTQDTQLKMKTDLKKDTITNLTSLIEKAWLRSYIAVQVTKVQTIFFFFGTSSSTYLHQFTRLLFSLAPVGEWGRFQLKFLTRNSTSQHKLNAPYIVIYSS